MHVAGRLTGITLFLIGLCPITEIEAASTAESADTVVDTRIGADLAWLSLVGEHVITSETSAAYNLMAHFTDSSVIEVTKSAIWKIEAPKLPEGTVFQNGTLYAGFVSARQYITLVATYAHRGLTKTLRFAIAIDPHFYVSFTEQQSYHNPTYWRVDFAAASGGPNGPAASYDWDLDGDGEYDDATGANASQLFKAGQSFLIGTKAVDSQGREAIARKIIVTAGSSWAFWVDKPLQLAADALNGHSSAFRGIDGTPYVPDASRVGNGLIVLTHGLFSSTEESWIKNLAEAIQTRLAPNLPNICLFDWRGMADPTLFGTGGRSSGQNDWTFPLKLDDYALIKGNALTQGQVLADWIRTQIELGNIRSDRPIHLIGHSAGGFVMGECGTILKSVVSQVTMLDTPTPAKRHFREYPTVGFVERYITSRYGLYCTEFMSTGDLKLNPLAIISRIEPHSHYVRSVVDGPSGFTDDHSFAYEWYRNETVSGFIQDGFYYSPLLNNGFHGASRESFLAARQTATAQILASSIPDQSITDFPTFGSVSQTNEIYTLTETGDAGLAKRIDIPVGAQSLKFRFQFIGPGDGDFLAVYWGTNSPVLYVGLDLPLSRDSFLEAEVPVSDYARQSKQLAFVLASRRETNAVLVIDQIRLTLTDDPDGDALTTDQEQVLGTDPLKVDTDGDGLSDADEVNTYHTNPLLADSDWDGQLDGVEITAGTDPANSVSTFKITGLVVGTNNEVILQWSGSTDRLYRVNSAGEPGVDNYQSLVNNLSSNQFSASGGATNIDSFYWIQLDDQP